MHRFVRRILDILGGFEILVYDNRQDIGVCILCDF